MLIAAATIDSILLRYVVSEAEARAEGTNMPRLRHVRTVIEAKRARLLTGAMVDVATTSEQGFWDQMN
ncbi:MAG: hypothetical protein NVSMB57_08920 [Actinomycetota bacterium]